MENLVIFLSVIGTIRFLFFEILINSGTTDPREAQTLPYLTTVNKFFTRIIICSCKQLVTTKFCSTI